MNEWVDTTLSDICEDISYGYTASANTSPVGPKFLRITDIVPDRINWDTVPFCEADDKNKEKYRLSIGDIVIARTGATTGYNKTIKSTSYDTVYASYLIRYRINPQKANPFYIGHVLQSNNWFDYVDAIAGGSAQPGANAKQLGSYELKLPPLPEQKAIASVLSSLDDKIDLLHRQNKTLEAMAETLFRQWFIENDEGAEIPITDIIIFNPKETLPKGTVANYLEMANVQTSSFHPTNWYEREFNSGTKFRNGDTLLARITPCLENGKTCYVTFLEEDSVGWGSTEFIVMRAKKGIHPFITYVLSKNQTFRDYAEGCMEGSSGRQRVNNNHLKNFTIISPSNETLSIINDNFELVVQRLNYNFRQVMKLESLREALLPKLMSGEVKIKSVC